MSEPQADPIEEELAEAEHPAAGRIGQAALVSLGLFVVWVSFYLVALAEKISRGAAPPAVERVAPAPPAPAPAMAPDKRR